MNQPAKPNVGTLLHKLKQTFGARAAGSMRVSTFSNIRWIGMAGQLFTVLLIHFSLGIELPLLALIAVIFLIPLPTLYLAFRNANDRVLRGQIALSLFMFDVGQIGMMLALTGGLLNPFTIMMILPVALAAAVLDRISTMVVTAWAIAIITTMTFVNLPLPWPGGPPSFPPLYIVSMWIALNLALLLIAIYTLQLASDSRRQADAFAATQLALAREQQWSALGSQAAAVAHHLGSPLATINIVAKELVRELPKDHPMAADAADLLDETLRCREILATLARPQPEEDHSQFTTMPLSLFMEELVNRQQNPEITVKIVNIVEPGCAEPTVSMPPERRHALANLIENATSFAEHKVTVTLRSTNEFVIVTVQDDGPGFPPEVMDRIGEPYISTRESEGGMGLGIYIANSLLVRDGARLHFGNTTRGAQVRIQWPREALTV